MLVLLTTQISVGIVNNMKASLVLDKRHVLSDNEFVDLVVWHSPSPASESHHEFKYRLALIVDGSCVVRDDNETGKGDHKHFGEVEVPYQFTSPEDLLRDFWKDVEKWRP